MRAGVAGVASAALACALLLPGAGAAQDGDALDRRVRDAGADRVAFRFEVDPDVTVCENGFRRGEDGDTYWGRWSGDGPRCPGGPLEVVVTRGARGVRDVDFGPVGHEDADVDLGEVSPSEASEWLLSLAYRGADADAAEEAMAGAVVARDVDAAPALVGLARDRDLDGEVRRSALFWVSQEAARGIDTTLAGIAADEAEDQDVRDAAVFGLSQRPESEAVPALMDLARTAPHVKTRKTALFWLSQCDDDRVVEFFSSMILGSGG